MVSREQWRTGFWIFGLALVVRAAFLVDSADYPAFAIPINDARTYDEAARQWLQGGGMSDQFFWQPFFYPFILTCTYLVTGGSVLGAKLVQAGLGAVTCLLTYRVGRQIFGRTAGVVAGVVAAFYGPLIFYDAELLPIGWAAFWAVLLLLLLLGVAAQPSGKRCLVLGAVSGLAVLTRAEFLPFSIGAFGWLLRQWGAGTTGWRACARHGLTAALGFALVAIPVAAQNARVTGRFGFLPAAGGVNVYIGNHPEEDMVARAVSFEWDRLQRMPEAEGIGDLYGRQDYFYRQTWAYARDDPAGLVARLGSKALQFLTSRELPRSTDVYFVRDWSRLQTLLTWKVGGFGFPFGALLPLAVVGLWHSWRRVPSPLLLLLALYPLAVVLVFVTGPYRLPVVPALAILAGAGGTALVGMMRERQWRRLAISAGAVAGTVLISTLPGPYPLEQEVYDLGFYLNIGDHHTRRGELEEAFRCYERHLQLHPDSVPAHTALGHNLRARSRPEEALQHFAAAVRIRPDLAEARNNLGLALREAGRLEEAAEEFRAGISVEPAWAALHSHVGLIRLQQRRFGEAATAFREATRLAPHSGRDYFHLGIALAEQREFAQAVAAFRRAVSLSPNDPQPRFLLAVALEDAGQPGLAAEEYRIVLGLDPDHREASQRLRRLEQRFAPR